MDFEDSGIDSDPKTSSSETDTLKQKNEPIISFSPQRGRFDSVQSNSRKSSTTFPITVDDLQLDDPLVNSHQANPLQSQVQTSANHASSNPNSLNNLLNSSTPNNTLQKGVAIHQISQQQQQQSNFASIHNHIPYNNQNQAQQPYSFLHNQDQSKSNASSNALQNPLIINTSQSSALNSASTSHPLVVPGKTFSRAPGLPPQHNSQTSAPSNSISLMVNGAVLSTNNNNNNPAPTPTALDLQKRLERRIAQASAVASTTASSTSTVNSKPNNDSILTDIIGSVPSTGAVNNNALLETSGTNNGNQISFSPQNSGKQKVLDSSSLWEPDPSASEIEDLLWESKTVQAPPPHHSNTDGSSSKVDHIRDSCSSNTNNGSSNCSKGKTELVSTCSNDTPSSNNTTATIPKPTPEVPPISNNNNNNGKVNKSGGSSSSSSNKNNSSKSSQSSRSGSSSCNNNTHNTQGALMTTTPTTAPTSTSSSSSSSATSVIVVNSGFDIRKVAALLPPQRLAIPCKQPNTNYTNSQMQSSRSVVTTNNTNGKFTDDNDATTTVTFPSTSFSSPNSTTTTAPVHKTSTRSASVSETSCNDGNATGVGISSVLRGNGNVKSGSNSSKLSSEKKPLVEWDSDESEEELSFFPPAKRGVITDNLSIDNMSLSGEEEDLHLTPPRPLSKKCPCDPRSWLERNDISSSHTHGDPSHSIGSKPSCVIS